MFRAGETIGQYRILREVGRGATGVVYEVVHEMTGRREAMKVLTGVVGASEEESQRFLREIQVHAKLQHGNIASVHNAFRHGDSFALVLEYVEGEPLSKRLAREAVSREEGRDIVKQVLRALAYAHERGVIHRDIKPDNILLSADGRVKLTDFGLARPLADLSLTSAGVVLGSVYYMAPEQIRNMTKVDQRADLYSTGAVLYEVMTGRRPFEGNNAFAVMKAQVENAPEPPSKLARGVSPALEAAILKALEKDPAKRFATAGQFLNALDSSEAAIPPARGAAKWRAHLAAAAAAAAVFAAIAAPPALRSRSQVEVLEVRPLPAPGVPDGALQLSVAYPEETVEAAPPAPAIQKWAGSAAAPPPARSTVTVLGVPAIGNLEVDQPMPEASAPPATPPAPRRVEQSMAEPPRANSGPAVTDPPSEEIEPDTKPPGRLRRVLGKINPLRWRRSRNPEEPKQQK
jgi:serine/threonine-protein kinase